MHIDALLFFAASHLSVQIWDRHPPSQWRHNERDDVSKIFTQPFVQAQMKSSVSLAFLIKFPAQRASNAENVFIWWRHHGLPLSQLVPHYCCDLCSSTVLGCYNKHPAYASVSPSIHSVSDITCCRYILCAVSKLWDLLLTLSKHPKIWHLFRQHSYSYWGACQISKQIYNVGADSRPAHSQRETSLRITPFLIV